MIGVLDLDDLKIKRLKENGFKENSCSLTGFIYPRRTWMKSILIGEHNAEGGFEGCPEERDAC